ncbi:uncharacterized protein ARMOST_21890 [Armillaria ostoyae]|uniref:Uncharacterized protein n=1 Tax=Armillaria ostoyae TaxID=47428 RepID=A0A284SBB9_ARMOS|nr:uncharacterized protein ARMOST_21890 [Armillaria ostoyae]
MGAAFSPTLPDPAGSAMLHRSTGTSPPQTMTASSAPRWMNPHMLSPLGPAHAYLVHPNSQPPTVAPPAP